MSWALFKKRLKRGWLQWIDPEFDGDHDAAYNRIVVGDDDYYESKRFTCNGKIYSHFVNEDNCDEIMIRELVYEDGAEYYRMLDFEEFSDVWHFIVTGEERPASVETVTDSNETEAFLDALKGVLGDYLIEEEVDGGDQ